jgi:hypothetical protein
MVAQEEKKKMYLFREDSIPVAISEGDTVEIKYAPQNMLILWAKVTKRNPDPSADIHKATDSSKVSTFSLFRPLTASKG